MPRDYRFHRETEKCHRVGGKGPCGEMMRFTMEDRDFGICDCDLSLRCGRPIIYDPRRRRCYFVYDQVFQVLQIVTFLLKTLLMGRLKFINTIPGTL